MTTTIERRLSLPLTARDNEDITTIRTAPEYRDVLPTAAASDAAVVHAIFEEGVRALKERVAARLYEQMGADAEEMAERAANRERLSRRGRDRVLD